MGGGEGFIPICNLFRCEARVFGEKNPCLLCSLVSCVVGCAWLEGVDRGMGESKAVGDRGVNALNSDGGGSRSCGH